MKPENKIRIDILESIYAAGTGHPGGAFSCSDLLYHLYFFETDISKNNLTDKNRDRIVLSKGHAAPALYAVLAGKNIIEKEELKNLRKASAMLEGHPTRNIAGVEAVSGPLGIGFSQAIGMAKGAKLQNLSYRTYVILGDGECNEGQIWEGAMFAASHKLDNLVAIIDYNKLQSDDYCENITALEPLTDKWRAFGWNVIEIDGHDFSQINEAFDRCKKIKKRPSMIIAHTIKGKGVSFMENVPKWHGSLAPSEEELALAIQELEDIK